MSTGATAFADIDTDSKFAVSGYIREQHLRLRSSQHVLFQHVPIAISSLCTFYYHSNDYFHSKFINEEYTKILNNGKTLKQLVDVNAEPSAMKGCTSFGSALVPSISKSICKWDIKINKLTDGTIICGVSSKPYDTNDFFHWKWDKDQFQNNQESDTKLKAIDCSKFNRVSYGYGDSGQYIRYGQNFNHGTSWFNEGDIVSVCLNLQNRTLRFDVNNKQTVTFENIEISHDIDYRLAIVMYEANESISIYKFTQSFP